MYIKYKFNFIGIVADRFAYPGCRILIFSIRIRDLGSNRFLDPGSGSACALKKLSILTQKIVSMLSEIWSGSWFFIHPGFRGQNGTYRYPVPLCINWIEIYRYRFTTTKRRKLGITVQYSATIKICLKWSCGWRHSPVDGESFLRQLFPRHLCHRRHRLRRLRLAAREKLVIGNAWNDQ